VACAVRPAAADTCLLLHADSLLDAHTATPVNTLSLHDALPISLSHARRDTMIGTIIHGTHRNEDLIPAFVDALTERLEDAALNCPKGNEVEMAKAIGDAHEMLGEIERRMGGGEDYFLSEDAMW